MVDWTSRVAPAFCHLGANYSEEGIKSFFVGNFGESPWDEWQSSDEERLRKRRKV